MTAAIPSAAPAASGTPQVDRATLALARAMRHEREGAAAMVALIDRAAAAEGKGLLLNVRG